MQTSLNAATPGLTCKMAPQLLRSLHRYSKMCFVFHLLLQATHSSHVATPSSAAATSCPYVFPNCAGQSCCMDHTYYYFYEPDGITWYDARNACESSGAILGEPNTLEKTNAMWNLIRSTSCPQDECSAWIGLFAFARSGRNSRYFAWESTNTCVWFGGVDGHPADYAFTKWSPGKPNVIDNVDVCVHLEHDDWVDRSCGSKTVTGYICQNHEHRPPSLSPLSARVHTNSPAKCGELYYEGDYLVCENPTYLGQEMSHGTLSHGYSWDKTIHEFGKLLGGFVPAKSEWARFASGNTHPYGCCWQNHITYSFNGNSWSAHTCDFDSWEWHNCYLYNGRQFFWKPQGMPPSLPPSPLHPPPSPPHPPPSPPDVMLRPNTITASLSTTISVLGSYVSDHHTLVLLEAGQPACKGATNKRHIQGGVVINSSFQISLQHPGDYKVCHSSMPTPELDTDFDRISGVSLTVIAASPPLMPSPPPPLPSPPPPPSPPSHPPKPPTPPAPPVDPPALPRPPSPPSPLSPRPPSPPDVALLPETIVAGVPTEIAVLGSYVSDYDTLVFLRSGAANCKGAAVMHHTQGGRVLDGHLTVTLPSAIVYKVCHSSSTSPTHDGMFEFISDVSLIATNSPPLPPTPSIPPTKRGISSEAKIAIVSGSVTGVVMLVIGAVCYLLCFRRAHVPMTQRVATTRLLPKVIRVSKAKTKCTLPKNRLNVDAPDQLLSPVSLNAIADALAAALQPRAQQPLLAESAGSEEMNRLNVDAPDQLLSPVSLNALADAFAAALQPRAQQPLLAESAGSEEMKEHAKE